MARFDVRRILACPTLRRKMMVSVIQATQAREGIVTTREQAEAAYDTVRLEQAFKRSKEKRHERHPAKNPKDR